jgi:ammonium transporter Rh
VSESPLLCPSSALKRENMPHEATPLVNNKQGDSEEVHVDFAKGGPVSRILLVSQVVFLLWFVLGVKTYDLTEEYDVKAFIAFRDIMAMLLLGFGYLMTFLKSYGLGAVGFTMMLSVLAIESNLLVENVLRGLYEGGTVASLFTLNLSMDNLIDAEFAAATLMITYGALIGNATPLQLVVVCFGQSFFYAFNKVFGVLGLIGAEDVGGSMTIHMFGAYFGLACSYAIGPPFDDAGEEAVPDKVSDILALIGTTILWVFWPSFVGATETAIPDNEVRCVINTICALLASTSVTFYLSHRLTKYRFDPVHIANSTLAGGVAIGSSGRLDIGPGWATVLGAVAGAVSVLGYVYSSPYLSSKFGITDTCGVGNLHGYPSLVGGLMSVAFVAINPTADFLQYGVVEQMFRQFVGVVCTMAVSIGSGYVIGKFIAPLKHPKTPCFVDSAFWHSEYFEHHE